LRLLGGLRVRRAKAHALTLKGGQSRGYASYILRPDISPDDQNREIEHFHFQTDFPLPLNWAQK
jgi:hypothetical protein